MPGRGRDHGGGKGGAAAGGDADGVVMHVAVYAGAEADEGQQRVRLIDHHGLPQVLRLVVRRPGREHGILRSSGQGRHRVALVAAGADCEVRLGEHIVQVSVPHEHGDGLVDVRRDDVSYISAPGVLRLVPGLRVEHRDVGEDNCLVLFGHRGVGGGQPVLRLRREGVLPRPVDRADTDDADFVPPDVAVPVRAAHRSADARPLVVLLEQVGKDFLLCENAVSVACAVVAVVVMVSEAVEQRFPDGDKHTSKVVRVCLALVHRGQSVDAVAQADDVVETNLPPHLLHVRAGVDDGIRRQDRPVVGAPVVYVRHQREHDAAVIYGSGFDLRHGVGDLRGEAVIDRPFLDAPDLVGDGSPGRLPHSDVHVLELVAVCAGHLHDVAVLDGPVAQDEEH